MIEDSAREGSIFYPIRVQYLMLEEGMGRVRGGKDNYNSRPPFQFPYYDRPLSK